MNEKLKNFCRLWLPVILWMLVIFSLSSVPGGQLPDVPIPRIHTIAHFFEYSILGALLLRAFLNVNFRKRTIALSLLAVAGAFLFGLSDEWHQSFVPGRSCRLEDVLSDVLFAIVGVLLFLVRTRKVGGRRLS